MAKGCVVDPSGLKQGTSLQEGTLIEDKKNPGEKYTLPNSKFDYEGGTTDIFVRTGVDIEKGKIVPQKNGILIYCFIDNSPKDDPAKNLRWTQFFTTRYYEKGKEIDSIYKAGGRFYYTGKTYLDQGPYYTAGQRNKTAIVLSDIPDNKLSKLSTIEKIVTSFDTYLVTTDGKVLYQVHWELVSTQDPGGKNRVDKITNIRGGRVSQFQDKATWENDLQMGYEKRDPNNDNKLIEPKTRPNPIPRTERDNWK